MKAFNNDIRLRALAVALLCLLCLAVYGQDEAATRVYTPQTLPNVHLQDRYRYVCNPDGILSAAATDSIDSMLYRLEQQTGIETVVAVVGSIGEADCFDFCHELLNSWGVGKRGKDNGLVVLLVTDQRCVQFYTGYGLEGPLPDAICKRIQLRDMVPLFRQDDWSGGMVAGMRSVCATLDGSMQNDTPNDEGSNDVTGILTPIVLFMGFAVMCFGLAWLSARRQSRCPRCGKHTLQRTYSQLLYVRRGVRTEDVTYTCRNCGYTLTRRQNTYDNNYSGGSGGGPVIFGGGFGDFGGGGSFGGSFGGGSGGGGGAGTRF